jgi:hypothetical protein
MVWKASGSGNGVWRSNAVAAVLATFVIVSLAGCQTINAYSGNVVAYNNQAERSADAAIVLNVIRASKRRPLVFADLQTIAGGNPASGSLGLSIPLAQNGGSTAASLAPNLTVSGGPTTTVGVVNTQEFYKGMLAPVGMSTIDLFLQRGLSKDMLFNLFFSKMIFTKITSEDGKPVSRSVEADNYPGSDADLGKFQRLVEALIDEGLTTAPEKGDPAAYGPPLVDADLVGTDLVERSATAGLEVDEEGWCDLDDAQRADLMRRIPSTLDLKTASTLKDDCAKLEAIDPTSSDRKAASKAIEDGIQATLSARRFPSAFYQPQRPSSSTSARFCFDTIRGGDSRTDGSSDLYCPGAQIGASHISQSRFHSGTSTGLPDHVPDAHGASATPNASPIAPTDASGPVCPILNELSKPDFVDCARPGWNHGLQIKVVSRSTYGILYYLGELTRREYYPDKGDGGVATARFVRVRTSHGPTATCFDKDPTADITGCDPLFVLGRAPRKQDGFLTLSYDGAWWSVPDGYKDHKTNEIMDLVTEIVSLNRSAKDLPTSNVLTLVGAP